MAQEGMSLCCMHGSTPYMVSNAGEVLYHVAFKQSIFHRAYTATAAPSHLECASRACAQDASTACALQSHWDPICALRAAA